MLLFLKGLIIGLGKIIPGVSGSILAISLNVYEESIYRLSNLFSNLKENIKYLSKLCLGIIIAIILGSKVLIYFINNYYFYTFCLILGLIIGTVPNFLKKIKIKKYSDFILLLIPFVMYLLSTLQFNVNIKPNIFTYFILGFIEAITTIVPGISSTAIYISFNVYKLFLNVFINPFSFNFIIFSIGILFGLVLTIKLINYLFSNYKRETYLVVFSLLISSIITMLINIIKINNFNFIYFIIFFLVGFVISFCLDK